MTVTLNTAWYALFSRGARDWLRHNDKVREAVQAHLPDLIATPDLFTGAGGRTVKVPVRMLEHARLRLADGRVETGAGQGKGDTGEQLLGPQPEPGPGDAGAGGQDEGGARLMLEFQVDELVDWMWEELKLPDLKPRPGTRLDEAELVREGWDKRGAPSRLDRRRTVKEAIKRRAVQADPVPFTNEDLRFRQLSVRLRPSTHAVIFFVIDVSASMTQLERKLAKSFFFFALHGLRRQYARVQVRFLAHTTDAWEFTEEQFFQVSGMGGTMASSAFQLARQIATHDPALASSNLYLFYASDGENFSEDRLSATRSLTSLAERFNYLGYVETVPGVPRSIDTEMRRIFNDLARRGLPASASTLAVAEDVTRALRQFFCGQGAPAVERV